MTSAPPAIIADHITRRYVDGDVLAVNDVSLEIPRSQYVAIIGPSGSGKSTLLNLLGGLDQPDQGEIRIDGEPVAAGANLDRLRSEKIGYVFQSFYLLPTLTAIENIQIPMFETVASASRRAKRAAELLETVGLTHRAQHLPSKLSVGERQRVAIARSLSNDPAILLADEPTGNLDSQTGNEILSLFERLHQEREITLVVITHSDEVARRAERVIEYRDGRIYRDRVTTARS